MSWPRVALSAAFLLVATALSAAEPPAGFEREAWREFEFERKALRERLEESSAANADVRHEDRRRWDAAIFLKAIDWAVEYDRKFGAKDVALLRKATARGMQRLEALEPGTNPPAWTTKRGKLVRGYRSSIDGSIQPYGLIVPAGYDGSRPWRLDVVLHGSTRPVGLSELRFIDRFDGGDRLAEGETPPEVDYLELHPLGRVENGYRWAGETDVYEAIEAVCAAYRIDRRQIVLRGMSMGASGTWHLGLKRPDQFAALGPYCGYVDTHRFSETPLPNFVKVGALPSAQERMLHLLDSVDYAANAGVVPAIACMGEKDIFFDAHVIMGEAMRREGLEMVNLISPGTGHVIDPRTHAEQMRRIAEHLRTGTNVTPRSIRFVTWSLKYHRCHWLRILELERHYERTEITAKLDESGVLRIETPRNVRRFAIDPPMLADSGSRVTIAERELNLPPRPADSRAPYLFVQRDGMWAVELSPGAGARGETTRGKRPGLQGPIDDAFTTPFVVVVGTEQAWNDQVQAAAERSCERFVYEWRRYFRGDVRVVGADEVDESLLKSCNLVLFGDPGSNRWIREALPKLPIEWTRERLKVAGKEYSSQDHLPALIVPNPLPGAGERYLVLNSGHTFHERELSTLNYLLFPRLGDWAVLKVGAPRTDSESPSDRVVEEAVDFGLADEDWKP